MIGTAMPWNSFAIAKSIPGSRYVITISQSLVSIIYVQWTMWMLVRLLPHCSPLFYTIPHHSKKVGGSDVSYVQVQRAGMAWAHTSKCTTYHPKRISMRSTIATHTCFGVEHYQDFHTHTSFCALVSVTRSNQLMVNKNHK
jgi:hypothetical protein